jgi:hypothetical protein
VPPFSKERSIITLSQVHHPAAIHHAHQLLRPREEPAKYLSSQLKTPKLDLIHRHLWLAGLPQPARPLHRQKLLDRAIHLTESPDEHLVWHESRIFIKPIPEFLLSFEFWEKELCADEGLHECACGLLLSYVWLVGHRSDFRIARDTELFPREVEWRKWTRLVEDFLSAVDVHTLHQVDRRYQYGELRLSRLNSLYRFSPSVASSRNFVYGFMSGSTWYKAFFERHFAWMIAIFIYMTVILSAMQVGLATERLQRNDRFQRASYGFAVTSILAVLATMVVVLLVWALLFFYHFYSTIRHSRRIRRDRKKRLRNRE